MPHQLVTRLKARGELASRLFRRGVVWIRRHRRIPPFSLLRHYLQRLRPEASTGAVNLWANSQAAYDAWIGNNRLTTLELSLLRRELGDNPPLISIVMPIYNPQPNDLRKAVDSLIRQEYANWELCLANDGSMKAGTGELLQELARLDPRVGLRDLGFNQGISRASNEAAAMARGVFVALMDQDDELAPDALLRVALAAMHHPDADVIYSDEDKLDPQGRRIEPQFKPDWSPQLLLSHNYLGHLLCIRRTLFLAAGGFDPAYRLAQDYDLCLRVTERARKVIHVPLVLYHWRQSAGSSANVRSDRHQRQSAEAVRALEASLRRRGMQGMVAKRVRQGAPQEGLFEVKFPQTGPTVSIVFWSIGGPPLETAARHVLDATAYRPLEHAWADASRGSLAAALKEAAARCRGDILVFLRADARPRNRDWLGQLVGWLQPAGTVASGGLLVNGDSVVNAGTLLRCQAPGSPPSADSEGLPAVVGGYMHRTVVARNVSGVPLECMAVRRDWFDQVGGFDTGFVRSFLDHDLCAKIRMAGGQIVVDPAVEIECPSRPSRYDAHDHMRFAKERGDDDERYLSPHLFQRDGVTWFSIRRNKPTGRQLPRLVFVTHVLEPLGAPHVLLDLLTGFGPEVARRTTIISALEGPLRSAFESLGATVVVARIDPFAGQARLLRDIDALAEIFKEHRAEVVLANTALMWPAVHAASRAGVPVLWVIHESAHGSTEYFGKVSDYAVSDGMCQVLFRQAFDLAYFVVYVSKSSQLSFSLQHSRPNAEIIYNSPSIATLLHARPESPEAARLGLGLAPLTTATCVGSVEPRKGQIDLAKAWKHIRDAVNAQMVVVGALREPDYAKKVAHESGDPSRFILVGRVADPNPYLMASDVFVLASRNESYPLSSLEAGAFGLPLILSAVNGIAEQHVDGESALFFENGDTQKLGEHLRNVLGDPKMRERLGANARARVQAINARRRMLEDYRDLIIEAFVGGES